FAARVVNAIVDGFVLSNLERKTESNASTAHFLAQRIAELQSQIRNSEQQLIEYGKSHQILSLNANENMVVERLAGLNKQLRQAVERESQLRDAYNQQTAQTLTQNEAAVNYKIIQSEIDTNKTLLDGLLQRSKENDVVLAGTPNNIHVVDHAIVPYRPSGPKR